MNDLIYRDGDYEAIHQTPIWKEEVDFIIAAHTGVEDGRNQWEQIPSKRIGDTRFKVCCIPFFAKDISLGDIVETDQNFTITHVGARSGHLTFRAWLADVSKDNREDVIIKIKSVTEYVEWSSENLLAISASTVNYAIALSNLLNELESSAGLVYETGQTWPQGWMANPNRH